MKNNIKIILANSPLQNGNRGCGALTYSIIYLIDKIFKSKNQGYEIWLADPVIKDWNFKGNFKIVDEVYQIKTVNYPPSTLRQKIISAMRRRVNYFKDADFILNIGQGDSYSDIYGESRFNKMNRAYEYAIKYKKPYCILPQTIGPIKEPSLTALAKTSLVNAKKVMVRDRQSLDCVRSIASSVDVAEYIDVAFFMPYQKIGQSRDSVNVGLNVSALLWNGGYTGDNQFGLHCEYRDLICAVIKSFLAIPNVKVHLVAHVCEPSSNIENDYEVSGIICREFNNDRIVLAPFALDPIEAKSYIAGLDFFMGARMHATIAAFSSGVPVVPMAYSRKFTGLYEDTLNYYHVVDMRSLDIKESLSSILQDFENRGALRKEIENRNATIIKDRGEKLKNDLIDFFDL